MIDWFEVEQRHDGALDEEPEREEPEAWERFEVVSMTDELVCVHWSTNDDGDTGWPGQYAEDDFSYRGENALQKALNRSGVSRQGVGHKVYVTVDGAPR